MSRVISFSSGKGGVGKTTLVANFGTLYARSGKRTLLIDGDWTLGKLSIALGVRPQLTIERALSGEIDLKSAVTPVADGLFLLPSPSGLIGFEELSESQRNQLFWEIEQLGTEFDMVLLDHSSGIDWGVIQFAAAAHQQVIVTTPEPTSYTDAYAIMKVLSKRFSVREFKILVTQSNNRMETENIITRFSDVAREHLDVRVKLLDILPYDSRLSESIRCQTPFVKKFPLDRLSRNFEFLCDLLERECPQVSSGGLSFFSTYQSTNL